jgi:hypothetical protein
MSKEALKATISKMGSSWMWQQFCTFPLENILSHKNSIERELDQRIFKTPRRPRAYARLTKLGLELG